MGYIHNISAVMTADKITKRAKEIKKEKELMRLSKLQQEFYDLVFEFVTNDPETLAAIEAEEDFESYLRGLERDIRGMNAAELRHNIKVWKES